MSLCCHQGESRGWCHASDYDSVLLLLQTIKIRDRTYCITALPFKQIFFSSKIPSFPTEYTSLNFKLITTIQEDWDWITRAFQIYWILNCVLGASHLSWIKWISSNIHGKCFRSRQLILVSHLTAPTVFNLYRNYKWIFINIVEVLFVIKGSLLMKGS